MVLRLLLIIVVAMGTTQLGFGGEWQGTLVNAVVTAAALGLTAWLGWWKESGLTVGRVKVWWPLIVLLVSALSYLPYGIDPAKRVLVPFLLGILLVGLNEELFYRGVIQHAVSSLGRWRSCIVVAILFGFGHISRLILSDVSVVDTILLMVETGVFGFAYAAVRYRIVALWPLILLHAAEDIVLLLNRDRVSVLHEVLMAAVLLAWGCWVLATAPAQAQPSTDEDRRRSRIR